MTDRQKIILDALRNAEKALDISNIPRAIMYIQRCRSALESPTFLTINDSDVPFFLKKQAD